MRKLRFERWLFPILGTSYFYCRCVKSHIDPTVSVVT